MSAPDEPTRVRSFARNAGPDEPLVRLPGNPELVVFLLAVAAAGVIALTSEEVDAGAFLTALLVLTSAYLLSRGIAKASRVREP